MKRIDLIKEHIKDKKVLDIGFIQHSWKKSLNKNWLHNDIKKISKYVIGLDYLKKDIEILKKKKYDCVFANAENFNLNKKFEIVIAAELIEHLSNVGLFLLSVKKHMKKESELILTTPNAFSLGNIFRIIKLFFGFKTKDNLEHTHWYDFQTLKQVLERNGYKIIEMKTFYPERYNKLLEKIMPNYIKSKIFVRARLK